MITCYQNYWWFLISLLAALLVFLLFVQGGQSMLLGVRKQADRQLMVNSFGRKWELTFTTLVVFGGAFFASFPLFYSTSFGGAYWLWMCILFSFIIQAFSYEFRRKRGNLYGRGTYDFLLFINGCLGCILLGVAVGTMIFGAEFTINKANITDIQSPVISRWENPLHGLEALADWRCVLLGVVIFLLARIEGAIYVLDSTAAEASLRHRMTRQVLVNSVLFVPLFLLFMFEVLTAPSYVVAPDGIVMEVAYGYLANYTTMWWAAGALLVGVVLVLWGILGVLIRMSFRHGAWFVGIGTVLVVMSLFWVMGYNSTCYYPSIADPQSSLTIANSSSSLFTLKVMSWVSIIIVPVVGYIAYVWYQMGKRPLTVDELKQENSY